jgi:peptidoglycan/LPS O-acetylase OafA/YrhL
VLGVVAAHTSPVAINREWWGAVLWNGQVWVVMFFMLSGFLLYRPYLAALVAGRPQPSTGRFLRRRALRIVPGYWVALTLLAIWPGLPGVFSGDWWRYYGFLQIYPVGSPGQGLGVAWTLCVELTFYLVLPLCAAVTWRLGRRDPDRSWVRHQAILLGTLGLVSMVLRAGVWFGPVPSWTAGSLLGQFDYFAIGMGLAVISVAIVQSDRELSWVRVIDRFPGIFIALSAAVYLFTCHFAPKQLPNVPVLHLIMRPVSFLHAEANYWLSALASVLLMLPVVFGDQRRGMSRRILGLRGLVGLGGVSYGVYLYHDPVLGRVAHFVGTHPWTWVSGTAVPALFFPTLAISIPIAVLSYRYVELPFLRRRYTSRAGGSASGGQRLGVGYRIAARRAQPATAEQTADR